LTTARRYAPLVLIASATFVVSIVIRHEVVPFLTANRDEPVYLLHAETLRSGQLTIPAGERPELFHPWLHGERDGAFFSGFPVGWPAALAISDLLFGSPGYAMALAAAAVVVLTFLLARQLTRDHALSVLAAAVLAASPILWLQSAMYVSYLFTLALGLGFVTGVLAGQRSRSVAALVVAGACLGTIFLTRPLDALLWGLPVAIYVAASERARIRELIRPVLLVIAGALPLLAIAFAYNAKVTGNPLRFPLVAAEPLNGLGFGPRRIMPELSAVDYDLSDGLSATRLGFEAFPGWALGGLAGVGVALAGLWLWRRQPTSWLLLGLAVTFPLGYLAYWGVTLIGGGAEFVGPQYYIPLFALAAILVAVVAMRVWRWKPLVAAAGLVALAGLTVPNAIDKVDINHGFSEDQRPWRESIEQASSRSPALVFVETDPGPYLLTSNPFSSNGTDLDGRLLWAVDSGGVNVELAAVTPERAPYLQARELRSGDDLLHPSVTVTPLALVRGTNVAIKVYITNPTEERVLTVTLVSGDASRTTVVDEASVRGKYYDVTLALGSGTGAVPAPTEPGEVIVRVTFGDETYEQRIDAAPLGAGEVGLLAPGRGYRQVQLPDGPRFFRADIKVMDIAAIATN